MKRTSRPGWIGAGRVVFTELLPHQDKDDPRRHIVWVLLQGKLFKCSVHSVRPVTPVERFHHDVHQREDVSKMKTLSDLVPTREFVDMRMRSLMKMNLNFLFYHHLLMTPPSSLRSAFGARKLFLNTTGKRSIDRRHLDLGFLILPASWIWKCSDPTVTWT